MTPELKRRLAYAALGGVAAYYFFAKRKASTRCRTLAVDHLYTNGDVSLSEATRRAEDFCGSAGYGETLIGERLP